MQVYLVIRTHYDDYEIMDIYADEARAQQRADRENQNKFKYLEGFKGEKLKIPRGQFHVLPMDVL